MKNDEMLDLCKEVVVNYFNENIEKTDGFKINTDSVFIVWFSKTLQNFKALVSTTVRDGMYYELTYNGNRKELYLGCLQKMGK